jgi:hypothetical protein
MGYLRGRGDYYAGDYYAGDPGLFSGIGKFFGKVAGVASHFLPLLGPVGTAASLLVKPGPAAQSGETSQPEVNDAAGGRNPGALIVAPRPPGIITQSPLGTPVSAAAIQRQLMPFGMRKTHPNKSTYVTRGGGTSRWPPGLQVHVRGTEQVPTRRMNVANPRALRRALRRVAGFAKLTKRVRRAVSMAASAVGVRHHARKTIRRK